MPANARERSPEPVAAIKKEQSSRRIVPKTAFSIADDQKDSTFITISDSATKPLFQPDTLVAVDKIKLIIERLVKTADLPLDQRAAFSASVVASLEAAKQGMLVRRKKAHASALPKGFSWPKESYSDAIKSGRVKDIVEFLEDEKGWFPLIKAGLVSRTTLRARDRSAENGITNYLRDGTRKLPSHLHIPTKSELIDKLATVYQTHADQPARVYQALQRRKDRAGLT